MYESNAREIVAHGAGWNGTTSDDRTNYYETVPATDENLKWALGLEADRMVNVKITSQILETEMTVGDELDQPRTRSSTTTEPRYQVIGQ